MMSKIQHKILATMCVLSALILSACGSSDKKPGPYYSAKHGTPVEIKNVNGVRSPVGMNPLKIPKANQPLGAYDSSIKEPPKVVTLPEED